MNELNFIKGKGLTTKSIDDFVVSAYFEISVRLYEQIHKFIGQILQIEVIVSEEKFIYDCIIDTSVKNYITFSEDHGVIRLDIMLKDLTNLIMVGTILIGDIKLILPKK